MNEGGPTLRPRRAAENNEVTESALDDDAFALFRDRTRGLRLADDRWGRLIDQMKSLGVRLTVGTLPPGYLGYYAHDERSIVLSSMLTPSEALSTLAHEVGHATYGHDREGVSFYERAADRWAAEFLITPEDWSRHVRVSRSPTWLAECLGVTAEVVRVAFQIWSQDN